MIILGIHYTFIPIIITIIRHAVRHDDGRVISAILLWFILYTYIVSIGLLNKKKTSSHIATCTNAIGLTSI